MTAYIFHIPTPPRMLSLNEQTALLAVTGERRGAFRDHIILSMALATGLREHELLALDVGDIVDWKGNIKRRVYLRVYKRSAKHPPPQETLLSEALRTKLLRFISWKKSHDQDISPNAPLFISRKKNRLSKRQLRNLFNVWQKRAGFEKPYSFHTLRHCACGNLYRQTRDLMIVKRFARHASILSSMRYAHPDEEVLIRAVQGLPC